MNSSKNEKEILRDILLEKFEDFLDYIESVLNEELSDSTRMKNISNYTLLINWNSETNFLEKLLEKFEIVKIAKVWFMEDTIKEFSSKIKSWEFYVIPDYTKDLELTTMYVFKKKDKLDNLKQQVKNFLDSLLPSPENQYH